MAYFLEFNLEIKTRNLNNKQLPDTHARDIIFGQIKKSGEKEMHEKFT